MDVQKKVRLESKIKKYAEAEKALVEQIGVLTLRRAKRLPNGRCINIVKK